MIAKSVNWYNFLAKVFTLPIKRKKKKNKQIDDLFENGPSEQTEWILR